MAGRIGERVLMLATLVQIDPFDPVTSTVVSMFAATHDDDRLCHLNAQSWFPVLGRLPVLAYDFFSGQFDGAVTVPASSLSIGIEPWPLFPRYSFTDARIQLWTGLIGAAWAGFTKRFDGRCTTQPAIANGEATIGFAVDDSYLDQNVLPVYAGTGGAEGPAALKGSVKPLAIGAPQFAPGVLIDAVNVVYQFSAFAVDGGVVALDRLVRYPAPVANYASHAALIAATIAPGQFATCLAEGKARFGAPPFGRVSFILRGDSGGAEGWVRTPGKIARRIALLAGGAGKIVDASLNAIDTSRPYNQSLVMTQQTSARQIIQGLAAGVNAVTGTLHTGGLFMAPVEVGASVLTLRADGSALPIVASVEQVGMTGPFWKLALAAERTWDVHGSGDYAAIDALPGTVDIGQVNGAPAPPDSNRVRFTRMEAGTAGWKNNYNASGLTFSTPEVVEFSGRRGYKVAGIVFTAAGQKFNIGSSNDAQFRIRVTGGERLSVQVAYEALGPISNAELFIWWIDTAGNFIPGPISLGIVNGAVSAWGTIRGFATVPASGAAFAAVIMDATSSGAGTAQIALAEVMVAGASADQVEHPAFSPGPSNEYGATKNSVTYSATAPVSPTEGDLWVDLSGTFAVFKLRSGGAWVTGANALSAYNALSGRPIALADINTTESSKLAGIEALADVTANNNPQIVGNLLWELQANAAGTIISALPATRRFSTLKGTTDVSTTSAVSITTSGGVSATVDNTSGGADRGVITLGTGTTSGGSITLTSTLAGGAIAKEIISVVVNKAVSVPGSTGGAGSSSATGSLDGATFSTTSFAAIGDEIQVQSDGAGKVKISLNAEYSSTANVRGLFRVSYATASGGALTALGSTDVTGTLFVLNETDGTADLAEVEITMPAALTNYFFRVEGRRQTGSGTVNIVGSFMVRKP
jgi:hypothetical protein